MLRKHFLLIREEKTDRIDVKPEPSDDKVGNNEIGLYIDGSDLSPDFFHIAVTWLILKMSGKCPIANKLSNSLYRGKETGVAIIEMNFPGMPE